MYFTQSPIEASIWTAFVALQQWITSEILLTPIFKGAVFTWLSFSFARMVWRFGWEGRSAGAEISRFVVTVVLSGVGLSLLRTPNTEPFVPTNAVGVPWRDSVRVRAAGKYETLWNSSASTNASSVNGLFWYVQIHCTASEIGAFITKKVADVFRDSLHQESPYLFLQTMAQTAGATLDDPDAVTSFHWLSENCPTERTPHVLAPTASYSALFNLEPPDCRSRYARFREQLSHWARDKWGSSLSDIGSVGWSYLKAKLGVEDAAALENKIIASAMVNMARQNMGRRGGAGPETVHAEALLGDPAAVAMTNIANTFTFGGILNSLLGPVTGTDYWAADAKNQSAFLYNKIVQFLPPIRGYAKGLLAMGFVFAAAALCFGTPRFILAWLGTLVLFTAYEPLSAMLYETTLLFTNGQETIDAMAALRSDPMVLSGAAIIDDNIARIEAVYFTLQLALAGVCGAGGISLFVFSRRLGGGLSETITARAMQFTQIARLGGGGAGRHHS